MTRWDLLALWAFGFLVGAAVMFGALILLGVVHLT